MEGGGDMSQKREMMCCRRGRQCVAEGEGDML